MAVILNAKQRDDLKGSTTKQLREEGQIPAIVYGKGEEAQPVYVNRMELIKTVRDEGRNAIISLEIENDQKVDVMLHDYQMHPVRDIIMHADFYKIDLAEAMDVDVQLILTGEAVGTKEGGIVQQPFYELQVRAKPNEIPEEITVDITDLAIGDSLTIADLKSSDKYEFLEDEDTAIAIILPPEEEIEEETDEVDLSVEPEIVGADDDDEEEEN